MNLFRWLASIPQERRLSVARLMTDLESAIERHLEAVKRHDPRLHISDLEAQENSPDPRFLLDGLYSHVRLERTAHFLTGYAVATEVEGRYGDLVVTADTLLETPWGERVILEFKTAGSSTWQRVFEKGPIPHHRSRLLVYLEAFDAHYGIIVYENRDTLEWYPVLVERSPEEAEAYVRKLAEGRAKGEAGPQDAQTAEDSAQGSEIR
jgi:hypothetical protein